MSSLNSKTISTPCPVSKAEASVSSKGSRSGLVIIPPNHLRVPCPYKCTVCDLPFMLEVRRAYTTCKGCYLRQRNSCVPPAAPLVGIEPNPGPDPMTTKAIKKAAVQTAKDLIALTSPGVKPKGKQQRSKNAVRQVSVKDPFTHSTVPVSYGFKYTNKKASIASQSDGGIRYRHTEYVADIVSNVTTSAFKAERYLINPGNSKLFPWLADEASGYLEFRFNSLHFHLESLVGSNTGGMMGLASTSDCSEAAPTSKSVLMLYDHSARANVWEKVDFQVPQSILSRLPKYLVSTVNTGQTDTTRALGNLFVASSGISSATVISELYVTYDVTLYTPTENVGTGLQITSASPTYGYPFGTISTNSFSQTGNIYTQGVNYAAQTVGNTIKVNAPGNFFLTFVQSGTVIIGQSTITVTDQYNQATGTVTSLGSWIQNAATSCIQIASVTGVTSPWFFTCAGATATTYDTTYLYISKYVDASRLFVAPIPSLPPPISVPIVQLPIVKADETDDSYEVVKVKRSLVNTLVK